MKVCCLCTAGGEYLVITSFGERYACAAHAISWDDAGIIKCALRDPEAAAVARAVRAQKREAGECVNCGAVASFGSRCAKHRRLKPRVEGARKAKPWSSMRLGREEERAQGKA